ncbi:putative bifunctional diguanylate cyclase/phosphodiesterase [Rhodoferax antarcticus]|nr:EAL domain-containing protein [Rhodoferax antarcticus]
MLKTSGSSNTGAQRSKTKSPARILIVENEAIVRYDIRLQLEALGYLVAGEACSGEEAVFLTGRLRPDLVLVDIGLGPGMDGIAAAHAIREHQALPVVFLTAYAADDILERAMVAEPYGYILKPFSERELHTVLQMALYKHQVDVREHEQAARNQVILDNLSSGVMTISARGVIESFSMGASAIFGYSAEQVLGQNVSMLMPEIQRSRHHGYLQLDDSPELERVVGRQQNLEGVRQDGTLFPLGMKVSRLNTEAQTRYIVILSDHSERLQAEKKIQSLSFYDDLTGLPNRRCLLERLKKVIASASRSEQHGALIFLDMDHFRHVNEIMGPGHGDDMLCEVALRLTACVRDNDTAAHLGGDEFMVMLDSLGTDSHSAAAHAEAVAQKIRDALCQPYHLRGRQHSSSASVGIVVFDKDAGELNELLKMTDVAMYQAKAAGRNQVRFYDSAMQAQALARTELLRDMRCGLAAGQFVLYYQVQVDAHGRTQGAEALVRWQHPQRGLVMPGDFIAVAEESGLILELGHWVLQAACQQLLRWATNPQTAHWTMAVNVSALQFSRDDFVDSVVSVIRHSGVDGHKLKLELTESMLIGDVQDAIVKMSQLKKLGVSFSLDDFGTGYSSLIYLKRLPMDQLKIDQSFVRDLLSDPDDAVIAQAIVALGHNLGMQVIAEGVETQGQHDALAGMGCDAFQGYLFGRPVPHPDPGKPSTI